MTALAEPLHPADLIGMAHSPAYFLAAGAADRGFSWAHATPAKIADPAIHRLIDQVRIGPPPAADAGRYRQGAAVTIRTSNGRSATSTVYAPKGAGMLGIDSANIDAEYRALTPLLELGGERIEASLALVRDFRRVEQASALTGMLGLARSCGKLVVVTAGRPGRTFSSRQHSPKADCPVVHVIAGLVPAAPRRCPWIVPRGSTPWPGAVVVSLFSEGRCSSGLPKIGVEVVGSACGGAKPWPPGRSGWRG